MSRITGSKPVSAVPIDPSPRAPASPTAHATRSSISGGLSALRRDASAALGLSMAPRSARVVPLSDVPEDSTLSSKSQPPLPKFLPQDKPAEPEKKKPLPLPDRLTDAALAATKPMRSTDKVDAGEMPLAGYLLARHVDGRQVEGDDLERLRLANDSMRETRALLEHGRGNVREDIENTAHESSRRTQGHRALLKENDIESTWLSAPIWSGAGNCGEHADVSVAVHAARMPPGEQARAVKPMFIDHVWAESIPMEDVISKQSNPERKIVMDSWMDGPAVFESDSPYSKLRANSSLTRELFRFAGGENKLEPAKQQAQDIARQRDARVLPHFKVEEDSLFDATSGVGKVFDHRVQKKMGREVSPKDAIKKGHRSAATVVHDTAAKVTSSRSKAIDRRAALHKARPNAPSKSEVREAESRAKLAVGLPADLRTQIQAVGIARGLAPDMNVRTATQQAPEIVEAAKHLRATTVRGHAVGNAPAQGNSEPPSRK